MNKQQAINLLKNLEQSLDDYCELNDEGKTAFRMAITALNCSEFPNNSDTISRQAAIDAVTDELDMIDHVPKWVFDRFEKRLKQLPSAQPEIIRCKDCKHWKQQTNYQGVPLSFGFCESDDMWRSLYGETCEVSHIDTDDDFYCGYAERRTDD